MEHIDYIESLPFDGMVINIPATWYAMLAEPLSYRWIYDDWLEPLKGIYSRFTRNFVRAVVRSPGDVFDDAAWAVVVENWRRLARAAKAAGLRGIHFDNEEYFERWQNYPEDYGSPSRSLAAYRQQTRLRGRQIMAAVVEEFPGVEVFFLHGPYLSEPKTPYAVRRDQAGGAEYHELRGSFFVGFVEGAGRRGKVIDGGEVYQYCTESDFQTSYRWRKYGIASQKTNCAFIPPYLRSSWAERVGISFGVYNQSWPDPQEDRMNPSIAKTTLTNALRRCDEYVWFYAERDDWLMEGGAPEKWVEAVRLARRTARDPRR